MKKAYFLLAMMILMGGAFVHGMEPAHNARPREFRIIDEALDGRDWVTIFNLLDATPGLVHAYKSPWDSRESLLYYAVSKGNFVAAETLLARYEADPNDGLVLAILQRDIPIIKFLLEHGANPDAARHKGLTARKLALWDFDPEILELIESFDKK